jgi:hypothetical protein
MKFTSPIGIWPFNIPERLPDGRLHPHWTAAVIHDYLYMTQLCERRHADRVFLNLAELNSYNAKFERYAERYYYIIRVLGWIPWALREWRGSWYTSDQAIEEVGRLHGLKAVQTIRNFTAMVQDSPSIFRRLSGAKSGLKSTGSEKKETRSTKD